MYHHPVRPSEQERLAAKNCQRVTKKKHVPAERNFGSFLISPVIQPNIQRPKMKKPVKSLGIDVREVSYGKVLVNNSVECHSKCSR